MKRYSIAPSSSRRKSTIGSNFGQKAEETIDGESATLELERLEQEITLALQEIDKNLSKANSVINDKIFPILKLYAASSANVWNNVNFWKYFLEQAANVELTSYEAPAHLSSDLNAITNTKSNLLLLDDDFEQRKVNDELSDSDKILKHKDFKKPLLKGFANTEEQTPTWSTEQQNIPPSAQYDMQASTPQLKKRSTFFDKQHVESKVKSSGKNASITAAQTLSSEESSSTLKLTHRIPQVPVLTHTIRQSLDNYQRISISPQKNRSTQSPRKPNIADDVRRRSSMIQNFIDSSPTLPEPPVLLSEIGYTGKGGNIADPSEDKNLDRLSPIALPPRMEVTPDHRKNEDNTIQRFPRTPNYASHSKDNNIMRTPLGVRLAFGEDSDLPPPNLGKGTNQIIQGDVEQLNDEDDDVPLPVLETIQLPNKRHRPNEEPKSLENFDNFPNDDEQNVFLDNSARNNSAASTIYHSLANHKSNSSSTGSTPLQRDSMHTNSRSISYLFEEVLYNANVNEKGQKIKKKISGPKDLFQNLGEDFLEDPNDKLNDKSLDNHESGNSTNELGSLLGERLKNLTNYTKST